MASFKKARFAALALLSAVALPGALVAACSGDDNGSNPVPPVPTYGVDATALPDSTTPQGGEDSSSGGGDGSSSSTPDVIEEGRIVLAADAQTGCRLSQLPAPGSVPTDAGCWNCAPQNNAEFLNQCAATGITCAPFDNLARLPGYDGGGLPPFN
jgi:hypothetical protein